MDLLNMFDDSCINVGTCSPAVFLWMLTMSSSSTSVSYCAFSCRYCWSANCAAYSLYRGCSMLPRHQMRRGSQKPQCFGNLEPKRGMICWNMPSQPYPKHHHLYYYIIISFILVLWTMRGSNSIGSHGSAFATKSLSPPWPLWSSRPFPVLAAVARGRSRTPRHAGSRPGWKVDLWMLIVWCVLAIFAGLILFNLRCLAAWMH